MLAVGLINQMNKIENSITQNSILSSVTDMQNVTWKDLVSKDLVLAIHAHINYTANFQRQHQRFANNGSFTVMMMLEFCQFLKLFVKSFQTIRENTRI